MASSGLTDFLKNKAATGLLCLSALGALAQNQQAPQNSPHEKLRELKNTEFIILLKSYHTDRVTPFNEFNPGIIVKQRLNNYLSASLGTYKNSFFRRTDLAGFILETKPINIAPPVMSIEAGLTFGIATYPAKRTNVRQTTKICPVPVNGIIPENEKRRGEKIMRYKGAYDSLCQCTRDDLYTEVVTVYDAHGERKKKFIAAALATLKLNFFNGNGGVINATIVPGLGDEGRTGGVIAGGLLVNPYGLWNGRPPSNP